jgi:DNA-binding SARP family transcriptional activator
MPFVAKFAAPLGAVGMVVSPAFDAAAAGGSTLFAAPPSYLLTEELAVALGRRGGPLLWLRLGPEDQDPGSLLLSLVEAMQRHEPSFGGGTVPLMRRCPGSIAGWPPLFDRLAHELAEALGPQGSIVVEDAGWLDGLHPTLRLLGTRLLSALPDEVVRVLTSHRSLPESVLPAGTRRRGVGDLQIDTDLATELIARSLPASSNMLVRQAAALCEGQPVTLLALSCAVGDFGADVVERAVRHVRRAEELLRFLAAVWLAIDGIDTQRALGLALHLGYIHPSLLGAVPDGGTSTTNRPWLQPLAGNWARIRAAWLRPLRATIHPNALPDSDTLHRAAAELMRYDAEELRIGLYLELDDSACATPIIAKVARRLLDHGRWDTLRDWLARLPTSALHEQPWLLYMQAELAAAEGEIDAARSGLQAAAERFATRGDHDGTCQSMLAESALVAAQQEFEQAHSRAASAAALADATGMTWHQLWSSWQLGVLAVFAGEVDQALAHFGRAADIATRIGDRTVDALTTKAEQLTRHLLALHRQREGHRLAYQALERSTREAIDNLRKLLEIPAKELDAFADAYGWMRIPMALKSPSSRNHALQSRADDGFWSQALRTLGLHAGHPPNESADVSTASAEDLEFSDLGVNAESWPPEGAPVLSPELPWIPAMPSLLPTSYPSNATLAVHLLGHLQVSLNELPVEQWPSGRARGVLKYLVTHRNPWPTRQLLMEVFWPNATPQSARNNLNVAIHGLRRSLRAVADIPVVVLQDDAYRLHPDVRLWLDVDEFERSADAGQQLEVTGAFEAASVAYEKAIALYQGDLLADDPYEQWALLDREQLRLAYLDILNRLSRLHFSRGRLASSAALCRRIVECDACREDAHRRLMRCYSRQGQPHLALRQYRACVTALRLEMDVEPEPATVELQLRIRRRQPV